MNSFQTSYQTWKQPVREGKSVDLSLLDHSSNRSEIENEVLTCLPNAKHKLLFLWDLVGGFDLVIVLLASSLVTAWVHMLGKDNVWVSFLSGSGAAIGTLGAFYSFALVFRTNICYARWWEGRTLWGTIIVNSIRIVQQAKAWIEDPAAAVRIGQLAVTFSYASMAHLRGSVIEDDEQEGANLVLRGVLTRKELDAIALQNGWQPYYCIDAIRRAILEGLSKNKGANDGNCWKANVAHSAMEETTATLASCIGGCIRVRTTGLPTAYDDIMNAVGVIFFSAACVAWAPNAGLYNPFVVLIIYVVVKMIIGVGNDMEDPFGHDESDLPLEKFCETIERQINAVHERAQIIESINSVMGYLDVSDTGSTRQTKLSSSSSQESLSQNGHYVQALETDSLIDSETKNFTRN